MDKPELAIRVSQHHIQEKKLCCWANSPKTRADKKGDRKEKRYKEG